MDSNRKMRMSVYAGVSQFIDLLAVIEKKGDCSPSAVSLCEFYVCVNFRRRT